jgi:hypothetical protein
MHSPHYVLTKMILKCWTSGNVITWLFGTQSYNAFTTLALSLLLNAPLLSVSLWLLYAPAALTIKISEFSHRLYFCVFCDSQNKQRLNKVNQLLFITETHCVLCEAGNTFLMLFRIWRVKLLQSNPPPQSVSEWYTAAFLHHYTQILSKGSIIKMLSVLHHFVVYSYTVLDASPLPCNYRCNLFISSPLD